MAKVKKETEDNRQAKTSLWNWKFVASLVSVGVLLLIANSALWVNNVLFNTEKFTNVSTSALLSESSRTALSSEVVDQVLADRPVVKRAIGEPATKFIAGLLDTIIAKSATDKVITKLQTAVTTKRPQNIELDLTGIKSITSKLINLAGTDNPVPDEKRLPDTIMILDTSKIPNFYQYGTLFLWLAPVAGVSALIILAYPHIKRKALTMGVLVWQGTALIATGLFALLVGPLFRPALLAQVENPNFRIVVGNVYNAFIATFNQQSSWFFIAGTAVLLVPLGVYIYSHFVAGKLKFSKQK